MHLTGTDATPNSRPHVGMNTMQPDHQEERP